jgi:hypothetical protein
VTEDLHAFGNLIMKGPTPVGQVFNAGQTREEVEALARLLSAAFELRFLVEQALGPGCTERWKIAAQALLHEIDAMPVNKPE